MFGVSSEYWSDIKKNPGGAKMVRTSSIFMQSLVEIRRCMAAWERKVGSFCFFLFVTLWILNLNKGLAHQRFSHSNSDIVAICRSIFMKISAFLRGRNALSNHLNYAARCRQICLRIRSKFELFWKFEGHSYLCASFQPCRRRIEKIPQ